MGDFYKQLEAINRDWRNFEFIEDKDDERLQMAAINNNASSINLISNPSDKVLIRCFAKTSMRSHRRFVLEKISDQALIPEGYLEVMAKDDEEALDYIKNPSEAVLKAAVAGHFHVLFRIKDPSEAVQLSALSGVWEAYRKCDYRMGKICSAIEDIFKYVKNPSEAVQLEAVRLSKGYAIQYIKNPSEKAQLAAVKFDGEFIECIEDPSEAVQLEAVVQKGDRTFDEVFKCIKCIKNPTEKVLLAVVQQYGGRVLEYIKNPTEKVLLEAVKIRPSAIEYIKNPSEAVQLVAISKLYTRETPENFNKYYKEYFSDRVLYYAEHGHFPEDEQEEFKVTDPITEGFVLSGNQVALFNKVLSNIRAFLLRRGALGAACLYENDGNIILCTSKLKYTYCNGKVSMTGIKSTTKEKDISKRFIEGTIDLLCSHVSFSIKKISFDVSKNDLISGSMEDSIEEPGSINIVLS